MPIFSVNRDLFLLNGSKELPKSDRFLQGQSKRCIYHTGPVAGHDRQQQDLCI
jgi:hypothetical protein